MRGNHHFFRQRAPAFDADITAQDAERLAGAHGRHAGMRVDDIAHAVASENVRQRGFRRVQSLRKKRVGRVQRREARLQQHLAWTGMRIRHLAHSQFVNAVVGVHQPCTHEAF